MKRYAISLALALFVSSLVVASADEHFKIKEYADFHHLLHMLQHEALPKNDLATIRSKAPELIKLGKPIVKLGVPKGTKAENVEAFKVGLKKFDDALNQYGADAKNGNDNSLKNSYNAVHESFEELAGLLPS